MKHEKELICSDELMKYYGQIVDPLREYDRELLRKKVKHLKQTDGEGWACGESLRRIIDLLSMCHLFTSQEIKDPTIPDEGAHRVILPDKKMREKYGE